MTGAPQPRRRHYLDDDSRRRRPAEIRPVTFEGMAAPGPHFVDIDGIVPIEIVEHGDAQVVAACRRPPAQTTGIDLGPLADYPSVRSVVASAPLVLGRSLPNVQELLILSDTNVPASDVLRFLPSLERLWVGWSRGVAKLDVGAVPATLKALGVSRHHLDVRPDRAALESLTRFSTLEHLVVNGCWPKDSVAPLAALTALKRMSADAPAGWSALRACRDLEEVSAITARMSNLRALQSWTHLRSLTVTSGLKSFQGIEAFTDLERLHAVMLPADDLAPLAGLARLHDVRLIGLKRAHDLTALGSLPTLRRLEIARAGIDHRDIVHVDSVKPLTAAEQLEELVLRGTIVDDRDLGPIETLPKLRRVELFGDGLAGAVDRIRRARPDLQLVVHAGEPRPGEQVGEIDIRPPGEGIEHWWIREDLTDLLRTSTNAGAERRVRQAIASADAPLLARLEFDTEADAVSIFASSEVDIRAAAAVIGAAAKRS